ncbi:type 2 DNA topoisomerase 6 subunit B-like isoform X1 [Salmo salar]|uniref:Type 2 DNA topoisomerase 6 subunit B-like isoform X1 n=1 Tax=Salmo salar TaxID=8030 RepID=A0ABM3F9U6_SALSA|nr:type 2 DNA topoisomerase 6 subunit B-like isoform X1 [Salmo salar]
MEGDYWSCCGPWPASHPAARWSTAQLQDPGAQEFQWKKSNQISAVKLDRCTVQSHTEGFLHILSLTNAGVKIHLKLKLEGETYQRIFSGKAERLALKDQTVTMDVPPSIMRPPMSLGAGPWCQRGHPVLGGGLPLLILPEAMERGLYGELNLLPVTVLTPCVLQYSNLATRVTRIQISFINHITHIIYPCFGG